MGPGPLVEWVAVIGREGARGHVPVCIDPWSICNYWKVYQVSFLWRNGPTINRHVSHRCNHLGLSRLSGSQLHEQDTGLPVQQFNAVPTVSMISTTNLVSPMILSSAEYVQRCLPDFPLTRTSPPSTQFLRLKFDRLSNIFFVICPLRCQILYK